MQGNNVTFTSKIKFVDAREFAEAIKTCKNRIGYKHNEPNILKGDSFYSQDICTCTGGGLVKPLEEAEGFHMWDDLPNKKNFPRILNSLFRFVREPERGLLVGSKDLAGAKYSREQFSRFKDAITARVTNLSLFEKHKYTNSKTDFYYSVPEDTWLLHAHYVEPNDIGLRTVSTLDELKACYEKINIAEGDRLFVSNKEITPKDAPEFFA